VLQRKIFDACVSSEEDCKQAPSARAQQQKRRDAKEPAPRELARDQPGTPPALRLYLDQRLRAADMIHLNGGA
jgi:hypothetical protein